MCIAKLYRNYIFPRILNVEMSRKDFDDIREKTIKKAKGNILEIGAGTGQSVKHYTKDAKHVTLLEPNPGMKSLAQEEIQRVQKQKRRSKKRSSNKQSKKRDTPLKITWKEASAEKIPFKDNSFDTVVSTFVLCSIPNIDQALKEIHRVLKPNGIFLFVEHGSAKERHIRWIQKILEPPWKVISDGCHMQRDALALLRKHRFSIIQYNQFYKKQTPKILGYITQGSATKK